ncbi:MAG: hypothetical protein WC807_16725 [Hyphomicrobium sp.]|jgi:multidrug transporter EmrE-like cation transporter
MAWLFLAIAVIANIASNFSFKLAMSGFPADIEAQALIRFAFNPYLWLGALCCALLLGSYLMALREIELMVSYAFVISLSLIGLTLLSPWLLGTQLSLRSMIGVALVISGILTLALAPQASNQHTAHEPSTQSVAAAGGSG